MKSLKLFKEQDEYALVSEDLESANFLTVNYIEEDDLVKYNPRNYAEEYLTFENVSGEEWDYLKFYIPEYVPTSTVKSISYSIDNGSTWTEISNIDNEAVIITIEDAPYNKVLFKGDNASYTYYYEDWDEYIYCSFNSEQLFDVYGNIMSLFYEDDFKDKIIFPENEEGFNCRCLFSWGYWNNELDDNPAPCNIRNAKNLILPVTTLTDYCYQSMFHSCTSLTTAPELPATTLTVGCYESMFNSCTSLTTAPELPATILESYCYAFMFSGCTSLTTAPELPATTLTVSCYQSMFYNCSSLTEAPELPATTLASRCYYSMFSGCTSLTTAPELPATTLTSDCYSYMFRDCSSLNYIKMMAIDISSLSMTSWVYNVASSGTFIQNSEAVWYIVSINGIPPGWTISYEGSSSIAENEKHRLINNMLTFKALESGSFTLSIPSGIKSNINSISYSIDDGSTWTVIRNTDNSWTSSTNITITTPNISANNTVIWQGDGYSFGNYYGTSHATFTATNNFEIFGNLASLLWNGRYEYISNNGFSGNRYIFTFLFKDNSKLISAENLILPTKGLSYGKYSYMFWGCTNLVKGPAIIPSTQIQNYECASMFYNCSSLTEAPELPATTLTQGCYNSMFYNCSSLTEAPELPATTLIDECYQNMFYNCSSLTEAPELPATTLPRDCYNSMFYNCSSLTEAPELPATTLNSVRCYYKMFQGCTSLTKAPSELPATTLTNQCYYSMFQGCTSLTTAPELPATTLATGCYTSMFQGCTSLTKAPSELPATTLIDSNGSTTGCYTSMFQGCTSLTTAPELPATTLANYCYYNMFYGCSSLNYIKALFTSVSNSGYATQYWVEGVASSGTFVKNNDASIAIGSNGIPVGWTIKTEPEDIVDTYTSEYFTFEAKENNTSFTLSIPAAVTASNLASVSYSLDDGSTWTTTNNTSSAVTITTPTVSKGSKVLWKGSGTSICINNGYSKFSATGKFDIEGNIMSMLYGDDFADKTAMTVAKGFCLLFDGNTKLQSARKLILPVVNPPYMCYCQMFKGSSITQAPAVVDVDSPSGIQPCYGMFQNCASLVVPPTLPATNINVQGVYQIMFENCSSLTTAPYLPAMTIPYQGYQVMFRYCSKLVNVQKVLQATTFSGNNAYYGMFYGCSSLETAPELPMVTLQNGCYGWMFGGCSKLNYIKAMFTTTPSDTYTQGWVTSVKSTGTFVKNSAATWTNRGTNAVPSGWTIQTADA